MPLVKLPRVVTVGQPRSSLHRGTVMPLTVFGQNKYTYTHALTHIPKNTHTGMPRAKHILACTEVLSKTLRGITRSGEHLRQTLGEFLLFLGYHVPQKDGRRGWQEKQNVQKFRGLVVPLWDKWTGSAGQRPFHCPNLSHLI